MLEIGVEVLKAKIAAAKAEAEACAIGKVQLAEAQYKVTKLLKKMTSEEAKKLLNKLQTRMGDK